MNVKIDTKEKFVIITPLVPELTANMTEELTELLLPYIQKDISNIVLVLSEVNIIEDKGCELIAKLQQNFYENDCSFVICNLKKSIETLFDKLELLDVLNITPTESEAWDIVQMEIMEREMMNDED